MRHQILKTIVVMLPVVMCSPNTESKAQSMEQSLQQEVKTFRMQEGSLQNALQRLAKKYRSLIGFELAPQPRGELNSNLDIYIQEGTVRTLMDPLAANDPSYKWIYSDQALEIYPAAERDSLTQTVLTRFKVDQTDRNQAIDALLGSAEVQSTLKAAHVTRRDFNSIGDEKSELLRFSLDLRDVTVWQALKAIASESHSSFWSFARYGNQNQYLWVSVH